MNIISEPDLQAHAVTAMGEVEQVAAKTDDEFLREAADRIRQRMARTTQDIIDIGRDLIAVKDRVGHGHFLPWIAREFAMCDEQARRFMNVARTMSAQIPHGVEFHPAILYLLAAPSTPEKVRTEITERVVAGEKVTVAAVKKAKAEVKAAADRAEQASKQRLAISHLPEADQRSRSAPKPPPPKSPPQKALAEFKVAVDIWFSKMDDDAKREAVEYVIAYSKAVQPREENHHA